MIFSTVNCESVFLDDVCNDFKTGDIILFKACNNLNSIWMGNYYGHIGIIYVDNGIPKIFEACGVEYMPMREHHSKRGIFLTPVLDRIKKYKGRVYWRRIDRELPVDVCEDFKEFINYAVDNMWYNYSVIQSAICKTFGATCDKGTNCGELVFLSLIKLQLLPIEEYDKAKFHYLKYVTYIEEFQNNKYKPILQIIDHPFDQ